MKKQSVKRVRRTHSDEFRRNAVSLVEFILNVASSKHGFVLQFCSVFDPPLNRFFAFRDSLPSNSYTTLPRLRLPPYTP